MLWSVCLVNILLVFCFFLSYVLGFVSLSNNLIYSIILVVPVIQLCIHASVYLSMKKALLFIFICILFGFASEYIGTHFGAIFGVPYVYKQTSLMIADIPIEVMGFWSFFIYLGYSLTNSLYFGLTGKTVVKKLTTLLILTIFDALFVTAIDLFMDPLHVQIGTWTWIQQGPYFGIPLSNFSGWFMVAFLSSGLFRILTYQNKSLGKKVIDSTTYIQPINYVTFALGFACFSLTLGMWQLAVIGVIVMAPQGIITLYLLSKRIPTRFFPSFV